MLGFFKIWADLAGRPSDNQQSWLRIRSFRLASPQLRVPSSGAFSKLEVFGGYLRFTTCTCTV